MLLYYNMFNNNNNYLLDNNNKKKDTNDFIMNWLINHNNTNHHHEKPLTLTDIYKEKHELCDDTDSYSPTSSERSVSSMTDSYGSETNKLLQNNTSSSYCNFTKCLSYLFKWQ